MATRADWLLTAAISAGTARVTAGREQAAVARGEALLFPLGAQFAVTARSAGAVALRISLEAAAGLAEERAGLFTRTAAFICAELVTSGVTAASPLAASAARPAYLAVYGRPPRHTLRR